MECYYLKCSYYSRFFGHSKKITNIDYLLWLRLLFAHLLRKLEAIHCHRVFIDETVLDSFFFWT